MIDYDSNACFTVESNSDEEQARQELVPAKGKVSFFRKVCLRAPACEKAWLFERVPSYELAGYDAEVAAPVASRAACQELCLESSSLPCRSAEYLYNASVCRMSTETRRSQPSAYR